MERLDGERYNWWETDGWWDTESDTDDAVEGLSSTEALPDVAQLTYDTITFDRKEKPETFNRRLERLLFTYVTVFVESGSFSGVLAGVFVDFIVLVKGCIITEVSLREIEAIQYLAWGCPDTCCKIHKNKDKKRDKKNNNSPLEDKKKPQKSKKWPMKRNTIVKNRLDTATILRNLFSESRRQE